MPAGNINCALSHAAARGWMGWMCCFPGVVSLPCYGVAPFYNCTFHSTYPVVVGVYFDVFGHRPGFCLLQDHSSTNCRRSCFFNLNLNLNLNLGGPAFLPPAVLAWHHFSSNVFADSKPRAYRCQLLYCDLLHSQERFEHTTLLLEGGYYITAVVSTI